MLLKADVANLQIQITEVTQFSPSFLALSLLSPSFSLQLLDFYQSLPFLKQWPSACGSWASRAL